MLDLFPTTDNGGDSSTGGQSTLPGEEAPSEESLGGQGGTFPAPKGEATLLELNTVTRCPDDISFTDDLLEVVFDSEEGTLLTSRRDSLLSPWTEAVAITGPGSPGFDSGAEISHDGLSLWWMSTRPDGAAEASLYFATRATRSSAWSEATRLGELEGPSHEAFPTLTNDRLLVVFVTDQDLYFSTRESMDAPWEPPLLLPVVNTPRADTGPTLSGDGLSLYFTSTRLGGVGGTDLYVTHRANRSDDFSTPVALTALNTPENEGDPWVSSDGSLLVFHRKQNINNCAFFSVEL